MKPFVRVVVAFAMVAVGIMHFVAPDGFVRIVPSFLPAPLLLVYISGVCEIALGAALLVPRVRKWAAYGLVALFIAVYPANIYMAVMHIQLDPAHPLPEWVAWVRLPFQFLFIAIAVWIK